MKKIKRTITVRKVEFFSNQLHNHEINAEVCPFCHSPLPADENSAVENRAEETPKLLRGEKVKVDLENDEIKKNNSEKK